MVRPFFDSEVAESQTAVPTAQAAIVRRQNLKTSHVKQMLVIAFGTKFLTLITYSGACARWTSAGIKATVTTVKV